MSSAIEKALGHVRHEQVDSAGLPCIKDCPRCALDRAKEEVDRLAYQLRDYAETWHKIQRHNGTFDNCGAGSCAPARAALAPFQPETKP